MVPRERNWFGASRFVLKKYGSSNYPSRQGNSSSEFLKTSIPAQTMVRVSARRRWGEARDPRPSGVGGSLASRGRLWGLFLGLAALGTLLAVYHAYGEITENFSGCTLNSSVSCGAVFESGYTSVFGVPFYALGIVWFPAMAALGFVLVRRTGGVGAPFMPLLLMVGNVFTVYLWYLEIFVIRAYCPVCISMYLVNYAMTAAAALDGRRGRGN